MYSIWFLVRVFFFVPLQSVWFNAAEVIWLNLTNVIMYINPKKHNGLTVTVWTSERHERNTTFRNKSQETRGKGVYRSEETGLLSLQAFCSSQSQTRMRGSTFRLLCSPVLSSTPTLFRPDCSCPSRPFPIKEVFMAVFLAGTPREGPECPAEEGTGT